MPLHKVGIIGYGGFGNFLHHAWKKLEKVEVIAVADPMVSRTPDRDIHYYQQWRELLKNENIDIVAIVTPPATHAEIACAAMQAGKHIFLEKPIAITYDDARQIIHTRDVTGKKAAIDFMMRFNPIIECLGIISRERIFGELRRVDVENYAQDSSLPDDHWFWDVNISGGILIEHGVHFIDIIHSLADAKHVRVHGLVSSHNINNENQVLADVLYDTGLITTHFHSFSRPGFFEDTSIRFSYDLAQIDIHGWIPLNGEIRVLVNDTNKERIFLFPELNITREISIDQIEDVSRPEGWGKNLNNNNQGSCYKIRSGGLEYDVEKMIEGKFKITNSKAQVYSECVRSVMADLIQAIEKPDHKLRSNLEDGLISLEVASSATICGREANRT